jgi:hypothetical protein
MTDGRHLPRSGLTTPGRTSFKGPVRQGEDTGIPGTVTLGEAVFTQRAEISAAETSATTVFVLPSDHQGGAVRSDIISIEVLTDVIWETSASAVLELTLGSAAGTARLTLRGLLAVLLAADLPGKPFLPRFPRPVRLLTRDMRG